MLKLHGDNSENRKHIMEQLLDFHLSTPKQKDIKDYAVNVPPKQFSYDVIFQRLNDALRAGKISQNIRN